MISFSSAVSGQNFNVNNVYCIDKNFVERLLIHIGFRNKLLGTGYLASAIVLQYNRADRANLTQCVYPAIANKHNTQPHLVECAIRHAIVDCYNNGNLSALNDMFNSVIVSKLYPPSNGELINAIVTCLRLYAPQQ